MVAEEPGAVRAPDRAAGLAGGGRSRTGPDRIGAYVPAMIRALTRQDLNRALLARQLLLERSDRSPLDAVGHLAGLQAQAPTPPYTALWARLADFDPADVSRLLVERRLVRATTMRGTIHLLVADDLVAWRGALQPLMDAHVRAKALRERLGTAAEPSELAVLLALGDEALTARPRTTAALAPVLADRWPDADAAALATAVRMAVPTVQVPPRGLWRTPGPAAFTTVRAWLGRDVADPPDVADMARRYLAAFGPASVADVQAWAGITRLGPVVRRLGDELVVLRDEAGRELFDLRDAPRPGGDVAAPVRLLGEWDQALLAHADRSRIIDDAARRQVFTVNGIVHPTVLVDGTVAGRWHTERSGTTVTATLVPFRSWRRTQRAAAVAEAEAHLAFAEPDADEHRVRVAEPG